MYESGKTKMSTEHNPKHPLRKKPAPGWMQPHPQELCHQAKSHCAAPWRAATPFLTSACASPSVQFSVGKVWIQACLLCLGLSSCRVSGDIPCPAPHWPGTCAAQMPGTAFIQGPHPGCCSTPPPVLSAKDYHKYGPTLLCGDFLQNQDFEFAAILAVWSCRQGVGYQITPTVSSGKESSVAFCLLRWEIFAQASLSYLSGFLTCESSIV